MKDQKSLTLRIAESSSPLGAAILGLGLGAWFSSDLKDVQWLLIISGGILHLFGMVVMNKHDKKLELLSPFWRISFQLLFWICVLLLVAVFFRIIWLNI
jgi:hypothetical protein